MDTKAIKCFLRVCQSGSLSKAAQHLYVSQQGLGAILDRLEKELGCKLFHRGARGTRLTMEGQYFLPHAEKILEIAEGCINHFQSDPDHREPLPVACTFGVYNAFASQFLHGFQTQYPNVRIVMTEYPDTQCEKVLKNGGAEVGFTTGPIGSSTFVSRLMTRHQVCAVVHTSHPLSRQATLQVSQLREQPVILLNSDFHIHLDFVSRCFSEGFAPNILFEAAEIALVHRMAEKGAGVGITIGIVYEGYKTPQVRVIPFEDASFTWDIYLAQRTKAPFSKAMGLFQTYLTETE